MRLMLFFDGRCNALSASCEDGRQRTQHEVVGLQILCRLAPRPLDFRSADVWLDRPNHTRGDLILKVEHILGATVEPVGP